MKGGVSYIAQSYSEANNKYGKSYNKDKASKDIIYKINLLLRYHKVSLISMDGQRLNIFLLVDLNSCLV